MLEHYLIPNRGRTDTTKAMSHFILKNTLKVIEPIHHFTNREKVTFFKSISVNKGIFPSPAIGEKLPFLILTFLFPGQGEYV